jgi:hypothetical protein
VNSEIFQSQFLTITGTNEISIYKGELTKQALVEQTKRVLKMFPKFPQPMLEELKNAFADNGFSDERMKDAVNHVRDTYEGWDKLPNIANFIQFDKKIKVLTYDELVILVNEKTAKMCDYIPINTGLSKPRWVLKELQEKYKLELWSKK